MCTLLFTEWAQTLRAVSTWCFIPSVPLHSAFSNLTDCSVSVQLPLSKPLDKNICLCALSAITLGNFDRRKSPRFWKLKLSLAAKAKIFWTLNVMRLKNKQFIFWNSYTHPASRFKQDTVEIPFSIFTAHIYWHQNICWKTKTGWTNVLVCNYQSRCKEIRVDSNINKFKDRYKMTVFKNHLDWDGPNMSSHTGRVWACNSMLLQLTNFIKTKTHK